MWNRLRWIGRLATSWARPGPTFVVIGAPKSGTTSLLAYLATHPEVGVSVRKEVRFFDFNYARGQGWYRAHFPSAVFWLRVRLRTGRWPMVGEATPYYFAHPHAPLRVRRFDSRLKLILLLREPAARAYSHYLHARRGGYEQLSFQDAIDAEPGRLQPELERLRTDEQYISLSHFRLGYLDGSRYGEQLTRWLAAFPREQIMVVKAERLFRQPAAVMAEIGGFLGLSQIAPVEFPVRNAARYELPPREWLDDARRRLRADTEMLLRLLPSGTSWEDDGRA